MPPKNQQKIKKESKFGSEYHKERYKARKKKKEKEEAYKVMADEMKRKINELENYKLKKELE